MDRRNTPFEDDFNTWLKEPEFAAEYWKTRFKLEQREKMKFQRWFEYLTLDPSQAEYNPEIKAYIDAQIRSDYERGRLLISDEKKKELYG